MSDTTPNHNLPGWDATDTLATTSLAKQWAKKYLQKLIDPDDIWDASSKGMRSLSGEVEGRSLLRGRVAFEQKPMIINE